MKTLDDYLKLNYKASVYRDDEGGFIAEVDDLPGCAADGATPDEAFRNLDEAKRVWMKSRLAAGLEIPEPRQLEDYSGKVLLRMPRSLHRRLSEQSAAEGVSLNHHIVSLLSYASAGNRAFTLVESTTPVVYNQDIATGKTSALLHCFLSDTGTILNANQNACPTRVYNSSGKKCSSTYFTFVNGTDENQSVPLPSEEFRSWVRPLLPVPKLF